MSEQPRVCPECGLNPIADGYSVCEVCAYRPAPTINTVIGAEAPTIPQPELRNSRSGGSGFPADGEVPECPRLADLLAGRSRGPHDDSTCGWCARLRAGTSDD